MTVGGPGRLLPAGGGEDGRFPEGAPGVQQEQLQQVPCGFRLQGFQPPALGVFAHQRIPLGTDYCDREDKHPPALPPPAVGQKECGQEAGAGAGRAGGRELGPAAQNRPDRQPGHDRGHLKHKKKKKSWEFGNSPGSSRFFFFFPRLPPPAGNSQDPPYLFGIFLALGLYLWGFYGKGGFVCPWRGPHSQNSWFFWGIPEFLIPQNSPFSSWDGPEFLIPQIPPFPLRFLGFAPQISQESSFPKIPLFLGFIPFFLGFLGSAPWEIPDQPFFVVFPQNSTFFGDSWDPPQNSPFPNPHFFWDLLPSQKSLFSQHPPHPLPIKFQDFIFFPFTSPWRNSQESFGYSQPRL